MKVGVSMGLYDGFEFRGFDSSCSSSSSIWDTDERSIFRNTYKLNNELSTHEGGVSVYNDIIRMFKRGDQIGISDLLVDLYRQKKEYEDKIDTYVKKIETLNKQAIYMSQELRHTQFELDNVYASGLGEKLEVSKKMKKLYDSGASLRKIAELYKCDKSTVRRRLEKMGIQIRK